MTDNSVKSAIERFRLKRNTLFSDIEKDSIADELIEILITAASECQAEKLLHKEFRNKFIEQVRKNEALKVKADKATQLWHLECELRKKTLSECQSLREEGEMLKQALKTNESKKHEI